MGRRRRNIVLLAVVLALVAAVVVVGRVFWERSHRTALEEALRVVPQASLRVAFTDWQAVRRATDVPATNDPEEVAAMVAEAYDLDFSAVSSLSESAAALQRDLGFSPGIASWEAYAQSREGATMVLRMPDGFDFGAVRGKLVSAGYARPGDGEVVWKGGPEVVDVLDPTISPELQHVALLPDEHLIVTSDSPSYAAEAAAVARGEGGSVADREEHETLTDPLGDAVVSAMVWSGDFACADLAMSQADEADQQRAQELVEQAGEVSPLSGLVMAMTEDRTLVVVEAFESDDQARANLEARARLAVGEAVGRGEQFSDRFELTESVTEGAAVVLTLEPREERGFVISAINNGPVLFATC